MQANTLPLQQLVHPGKTRKAASQHIVLSWKVFKLGRKIFKKNAPTKDALSTKSSKGEITMVSVDSDVGTKEYIAKFFKT
eukprot:11388018-Ditylum_brightwellii.AAC.1